MEEVPSAVQPIAGVGTSTAGFIGVVPDSLIIPQRRITGETKQGEGGTATTFDLAAYPVLDTAGHLCFGWAVRQLEPRSPTLMLRKWQGLLLTKHHPPVS